MKLKLVFLLTLISLVLAACNPAQPSNVQNAATAIPPGVLTQRAIDDQLNTLVAQNATESAKLPPTATPTPMPVRAKPLINTIPSLDDINIFHHWEGEVTDDRVVSTTRYELFWFNELGEALRINVSVQEEDLSEIGGAIIQAAIDDPNTKPVSENPDLAIFEFAAGSLVAVSDLDSRSFTGYQIVTYTDHSIIVVFFAAHSSTDNGMLLLGAYADMVRNRMVEAGY